MFYLLLSVTDMDGRSEAVMMVCNKANDYNVCINSSVLFFFQPEVRIYVVT